MRLNDTFQQQRVNPFNRGNWCDARTIRVVLGICEARLIDEFVIVDDGSNIEFVDIGNHLEDQSSMFMSPIKELCSGFSLIERNRVCVDAK